MPRPRTTGGCWRSSPTCARREQPPSEGGGTPTPGRLEAPFPPRPPAGSLRGMTPTRSSPPNFAARMGRWSATHRKKAILGWLAFVVVAVVIGAATGMRMLSDSDSLTGESATAQRILDRAGLEHPASETIIVSSKTATAADPEFRSAIAAAVAVVRRADHTTNVSSPLDR